MSVSASFLVDPTLEFAGNIIYFNASASTGSIQQYHWDFDDGVELITTENSATHVYEGFGTRQPILTVYETGLSATDSQTYDDIRINPAPDIGFSGTPQPNNILTFKNDNGPYYFDDTIDMIKFGFGDGSSIETGTILDTFDHSYSDADVYTVSLSAYDVDGHSKIDTFDLSILEASFSSQQPDYITVCGPSSLRMNENGVREINLVDYVPDYLKETDTYYFVKFFENFLNEMYSGTNGFQITQNSTASADVDKLVYSYPSQSLESTPKISILEKIARIADLNDPDLIDESYLQFFASNLGYNINMNRDEVGFGSFGLNPTSCSATDNQMYLKFMIRNLPNWYKIKSTRNMIRIMLYSFGLIGDVLNYYTSDYQNHWKLDEDENLKFISDEMYPTPHFTVNVNVDNSLSNIFFKIQEGEKIIRAIEDIRPLNTVFEGLTAITKEQIIINAAMTTRFSNYTRVTNPDYSSDYWNL